jgi:hypothetical protein
MSYVLDTIEGKGCKAIIEQDEYCSLGDLICEENIKIAYLDRSSYTLGTESVSHDRMDEIAAGINDGTLLGLPVYAYVHGGTSLRCGSWQGMLPQGHAESDSGQSGFVYVDRKTAVKEWFGGKLLTKKRRETILRGIEAHVEEVNSVLNGDVYYIRVEDDDGEFLDSCGGFIGSEYAKEEAARMLKENEDALAKEAADEAAAEARENAERQHWAERDVQTLGA